MDAIRKEIAKECKEVYEFLLMLGIQDQKDIHTAEDIASESFVRVWANAEEYRGNTTNGFYDESKPWLFNNFRGARRNILRQDERYRKTHFSFSDLGETDYIESRIANSPALAAESPQKLAIKHESLGLLDAALAQLAGSHREAIFLVYYEGLRFSEASKTLGIDEASLKMRLQRAKQSLKRRLTAYI